MNLPEQTDSDRALESLMAAGAPEELAVGIINVLVNAGCMQGPAASEAATEKCSAEVASLSYLQKSTPAFLRFSPIKATLPTLLLNYDQRIDVARDRRNRDMYSYARMASTLTSTDALLLAPAKAPFELN